MGEFPISARIASKRIVLSISRRLLENILKGSKYPGTFSLAETLTFAATRRLNAIAVAKEGDGKYYLAFLNGEPEGALYVDAEGALFGDKAVVHIPGRPGNIASAKETRRLSMLLLWDAGSLKKNTSG